VNAEDCVKSKMHSILVEDISFMEDVTPCASKMKYENIEESSKNGLAEAEAKKRLKKYGFNELKEKRKITPLKVLLRQFTNFIIYVLLAAAIISFFIGELLSFWTIIFIICFVIFL